MATAADSARQADLVRRGRDDTEGTAPGWPPFAVPAPGVAANTTKLVSAIRSDASTPHTTFHSLIKHDLI